MTLPPSRCGGGKIEPDPVAFHGAYANALKNFVNRPIDRFTKRQWAGP